MQFPSGELTFFACGTHKTLFSCFSPFVCMAVFVCVSVWGAGFRQSPHLRIPAAVQCSFEMRQRNWFRLNFTFPLTATAKTKSRGRVVVVVIALLVVVVVVAVKAGENERHTKTNWMMEGFTFHSVPCRGLQGPSFSSFFRKVLFMSVR